MRHSAELRSRFSSSNLIEYLREFESICKTGVQFNEKTEGRKSRDTVPLAAEMIPMMPGS
jgi:hypothetical protein